MATTMEQHYSEGVAMDGTPLKLFVGQVPKDMDEEQLRPLFEQAGPIAHIMVIRDRQTDAHRGCAFLTYQTREAGERAVDKFHNKVKLPNAHNPVQVRPADSQMGEDRDRLGPNGGRVAPVDRENKLFVGMLPHDADDMTLTEVFSRFGEVTEIYCMRNPDGTPKGCAFVKFSTRSAAIAAIEALHEKCTMEGATRALVVKFADVKKAHAHAAKGWVVPADGRGASQLGPGLNGRYDLRHGGGIGGASVGGFWQATGAPGGRDAYSKGREVYPDYANRGYPYQPGYPSPAHLGPTGGYSQSQSYGQPEYLPQAHSQPQAQAQQAPRGHHGGYVTYSHTSPYSNPTPSYPGAQVDRSLSPSSTSRAVDRSQNFSSPSGGAVPGTMGSIGMTSMRGDAVRGEHGGGARPQEGPPGANLFIYHLPNDLTDADLATAFAPFGHVVSAKVFLDKRTQESKGFGFVSYNHPAEAEVAISKMNGFQIGSKRLKVQHKKADHGGDTRDHDGPLRYSGHHGGPRDMQPPLMQQQQQQNMAPLHGGSGRLGGMGYGAGGGGGVGVGPPDTSQELRGYRSHSTDSSKVIYTGGGGDSRNIFAGSVPSSSYDGASGGMPEDSTSAGTGYRGNGGGGADGVGDANNASPAGGGMYHPDGGGGGEGGH